MKIQWPPGRFYLVFVITYLPNFLPAQAKPPSLILSRATRPVRSPAAVRTTPWAKIRKTDPYVHSFRIHSDIQFRFSRTKVQSIIVNPSANKSHEVTFQLTLPDTAFISKFSMTIKNETWAARVIKQEEAEKTYTEAVRAGKSAGLVETRSSNVFTVRNNVEASESITFTLTYDELLQRRFDVYEQAIHIDSDEVKGADDFGVTVTVRDIWNITMLRAIEREEEHDGNDEVMDSAKVEIDGNIGLLTWSPSNKSMGGQVPQRIAVQYDIERHPGAGQVLVRDGHFVHFFSPQASVEPKHIVFVLDVSGSMYGTKLTQMKEAMTSILRELYANHKKDLFSIITFHDVAMVWRGFSTRQSGNSLAVFPATNRNINAATAFVNSIRPRGMTNIHGALISALKVTEARSAQHEKKADPIIMFLTDGDPTWGITNKATIQAKVKAANRVQQVPIFCLGFGEDVEFPFLRKLSLQNGAVARKIYEASDAVLQLQNFYTEISSPAMSNVNFTYTSDLYQVTNLTKTKFSRFFKGSEIIVAGKVETDIRELNDPCQSYCVDGNFVPPANLTFSANLNETDAPTTALGVAVHGSTGNGVEVLDSADIVLCDARTASTADIYNAEDLFGGGESDSFMERLWAYLTIKQLLEQAEADDMDSPQDGFSDDENPAQRALDLALQHEFVTPITSLLVIRPDWSTTKTSLPFKGYRKLLKGLKETGDHTVTKSLTPETILPDRCQVSRPSPVSNKTTERSRRQSRSNLTIDDLDWLSTDENELEMQNGTAIFRVARNGQAEEPPVDGASCHSGNLTCIHLKDCVLYEFIHEFELYLEDYFCEISASAGNPYAGVCCPEIHKITPGTTTGPQPAPSDPPS